MGVPLRGHTSRPSDGRIRLSRRELVLAEMEKQIPPLRRRIRSGSGRNDRAFFAPESGMKKGCPPSLKLPYRPTQAKGGLEWATGQGSTAKFWAGDSELQADSRFLGDMAAFGMTRLLRFRGFLGVEYPTGRLKPLVVAHHRGLGMRAPGLKPVLI